MNISFEKILKSILYHTKIFFLLLFKSLILVLIYFLLIELGVFLNDNFGEDYTLLPIFLGSMLLVYCILYENTKNSLKEPKKILEIIEVLNKNIKNKIIYLFRNLLKTSVWLIIALVAIAIIWSLGAFIAGLSATTIIIILLLLILLK